jgi:phospholipase/carboxylesterase
MPVRRYLWQIGFAIGKPMIQTLLNGPRRAPSNGQAADSLVIFLHGYGSNGDDLIGLSPYWDKLLPATVFVSPNAPQALPGMAGAYQWFPIAAMDPQVLASSARATAPVLVAFIEAEMARHGVGPDRTVLVGFSQGTMMALEVGLVRPTAFAGIIGFSGALVGFEGAVSKPPVLLVHGDQDDRVPYSASQSAVAALKAAGLDARLHTSARAAHTIAMDGLQAAAGFLVSVLRAK